jgi:hypothetical protein
MWVFNPPPSYGVRQNPTQGEHFVNDRIDRNEALVREAIQNSLDARPNSPNGTATVKFTFRTTSEPSRLKEYHIDLHPHLKACGVDLPKPTSDEAHLLLVEDYGTVGLTGPLDEDDEGHFSLFWRNIGSSSKGENKGGRWGLGKTVFPNSSKISAFFGITFRKGDRGPVLMGQAALKKHKIGKNTFQPHAFYCSSKKEEFEKPIVDKSDIQIFEKIFGTDRGNQPGFSAAVLFPHESIKPKELLLAVVEHFFFPILQGNLVVHVDGEVINKKTIHEIVASRRFPELHRLKQIIQFATEVIALERKRNHSIDNVSKMNFPSGGLGRECFETAHLTIMKKEYQEGKIVGLAVPITIRSKSDGDSPSELLLFLQHIPGLTHSADYYLRGGISVIDNRSFGETDECLGILLAEEEKVSKFLGDSENPAHTNWNSRSAGLEKKYRDSMKTVLFIRKSLRQFFDLLAKEEGVTDPNALLDFFFEESGDSGPVEKPKRPLPPPLPRRRVLVEVRKIESGFRASQGQDLKAEDLPLKVSIVMAYDCLRGNPFSKYSTADFEIENSPIEVHTKGVDKASGTNNNLSFVVTDKEFVAEVKGFDPARDLKVRTRVMNEETE